MSDTSETAAAVQVSIYRKLSGSERLRIACDLSEFVRKLALSRLRLKHPEWSDRDLKRELLRYAFLPDELPLPLR